MPPFCLPLELRSHPSVLFLVVALLQYYTDGSAQAVRGAIVLDDVIAVVQNPQPVAGDSGSIVGVGRVHTFELVTPTRVWVLGAESAVDKTQWISALRDALPDFDESGTDPQGVWTRSTASRGSTHGTMTSSLPDKVEDGTGWQGAVLQETTIVLHEHRLHLNAFFRHVDSHHEGTVTAEQFKVRMTFF